MLQAETVRCEARRQCVFWLSIILMVVLTLNLILHTIPANKSPSRSDNYTSLVLIEGRVEYTQVPCPLLRRKSSCRSEVDWRIVNFIVPSSDPVGCQLPFYLNAAPVLLRCAHEGL